MVRAVFNSELEVIRQLLNGKLLFLIYVWVPEVGNTADTPNPPWELPLCNTADTPNPPWVLPLEDWFGVSAVLPTSGTQHIFKIIISYFPGATRFPYYISIHLNLIGARDQESSNYSAHFVEWKSSYITINNDLHHCLLVFLFLADQNFYRFYVDHVDRQHFRLPVLCIRQ